MESYNSNKDSYSHINSNKVIAIKIAIKIA